jgi:N-acetylglutamate synthase-like GNAT family acetyltransferase
MHRIASDSNLTPFPRGMNGPWLARRWYYTPRTRRQYSIRQVSPGDRRLLAEFAVSLTQNVGEREHADLGELSNVLFERVLGADSESAVAFVALESVAAGDRVIGVCACTPSAPDAAELTIAVAAAYREELIGRTLLSTLVRHARRAGLARLEADIHWTNRAAQTLAQSAGFSVRTPESDRMRRQLLLQLK